MVLAVVTVTAMTPMQLNYKTTMAMVPAPRLDRDDGNSTKSSRP